MLNYQTSTRLACAGFAGIKYAELSNVNPLSLRAKFWLRGINGNPTLQKEVGLVLVTGNSAAIAFTSSPL